MTCDSCHISGAPWLTDACNAPPMSAKRQLFYQVGRGIAWWREFCLHLAIGIDARDLCDQHQWLGNAVAQVDFE